MESHSARTVSIFVHWVALLLVLVSAMAVAQSNAVPFVNQPLVPASIAPGSAAFALTVNGTGFVSGAVVNWNGAARATTFVSSSTLHASITAADVASKGTATVTVVNPTPGGGISNRVFFPVRKPLLSVAAAVDGNFNISGGTFNSVSVAGDFTNDGKQDFVLGVTNTDGTGTLYFYKGNGAGSFFATPTTTSFANPIYYLLTGDFNNDGNLDILVGDGGTNFSSQAAVFLGDGHGHFTQRALSDNMGDFGAPVALGDFNGDGKLDMVYYGEAEGYGALFIVLGNGDGTFQHVAIADSIQNVGVQSVAVGDFNGDGKLDLAVGSSSFTEAEAPIQIFLGNGDGSFRAGTLYTAAENSIAAADLNGDGKLDLVYFGMSENGVTGLCVMPGNGDGTFGSSICSASNSVVQLADFNGDGKLDVMGSGSVSLGHGDGTFATPISLPFVGNSGPNFGVADFNGDGELDLAVSYTNYTGASSATVFLQTTLSISTASLNFGQHHVGQTSKAQTVTLTNIGTSRLSISSITLTGADPGDFIEQNRCTGIRAGGSCTVQVAFKPTATGSRTASLTISYAGVGNPQSVALTGWGLH
jgi:uncharacterized protein (DUF2141 family)